MIKKLSIFVLMVAAMCSISFAQPTPPTLSPGEFWTNMWSLSYDYQTNGSVRYLVQDPTNPDQLCAIFMGTHDSTSAAGTNRYIWYSYSTNGGLTWEASSVTTSFFGGFPSLDVRATGTPYIGMHMSASPTRGYLFADAVFGAGSWSEVGVIPQTPVLTVWPHIAVTANGNVVLAACPNPGFEGHFNTWNGSAWLANNVPLPTVGGPSGQFSVEADASGNAFIFGINYNTNTAVQLYKSADNGLTFSLATGGDAPPEFLFNGADTLISYVDGGKTGLYVGSTLHLVYSVYQYNSETVPSVSANTNWYKGAKIVHWSSATGIDTVAGRYNMPNMADTITQVLMTPLCQPSLGYFNGVLYCTYTAFLRGATQVVDDGTVVNAGEIFLTYSTDNGNTWTTPVNITNTPSIEEKHSSVARKFTLASGDSLGVTYVRDMKAGSWVNTGTSSWGQAPVYSIYRKLGGSIIGIKQDLEVVREFRLFQNYPNPFNPSTTISYYLQKNGFVSLKVYNVLGSLVATLVNGDQTMGAKEINFDGSKLASGIYYYTIETEGFRDTKKMILVK